MNLSIFKFPHWLTTQTAIYQDNKMLQVYRISDLSANWSDFEDDTSDELNQSSLLKCVVQEKQTSWIKQIVNVLSSSNESLQDADLNARLRRQRQLQSIKKSKK
jgi:hypothetical protein